MLYRDPFCTSKKQPTMTSKASSHLLGIHKPTEEQGGQRSSGKPFCSCDEHQTISPLVLGKFLLVYVHYVTVCAHILRALAVALQKHPVEKPLKTAK